MMGIAYLLGNLARIGVIVYATPGWGFKLAFFQRHIVAGAGLLLGPAIFIGGLIMHAIALHDMGVPVEIWEIIGASIFFLSVIGILIRAEQERLPAASAPLATPPALPRAAVPLPAAPATPAAAEARASDSNPLFDQLRGFYKDRTQAEGDRLLEPHIGRVTPVTGKVRELTTMPKHQSGFLVLEDGFLNSIFLWFEKDHYSEFSPLQKGDKVTVSGNLRSANRYDVHLETCKTI